MVAGGWLWINTHLHLCRWDNSEACSTHPPRGPQQNKDQVTHCPHPMLAAFPIPSHSLPLLVLPRITSQVNILSSFPCFTVCFREAKPQTLIHSSRLNLEVISFQNLPRSPHQCPPPHNMQVWVRSPFNRLYEQIEDAQCSLLTN